ncbi:MAG: hypothetical protein SAL70_15120 [Scytonema sp. PMC 1070.18]|nr:hypothetical protein [Scytonema sp. PMC 1070.18]
MFSTKSCLKLNIAFISLINFLWNQPKQQRKIHDYTQCVCGDDYVFEYAIDNLSKGYMTSQRKGVKRGDIILLKNGFNSDVYQVEDIDYYSEPLDMWIALLQQLTFEQ